MTNAEFITEIIDTAGSQFVSVSFTKANGEERQLTFNPAHLGPVKGTGTKCADPNIFRVVDTKLGQWRSFDARRVTKISSKGVSVASQKEEA
jgi:hypothetical protein